MADEASFANVGDLVQVVDDAYAGSEYEPAVEWWRVEQLEQRSLVARSLRRGIPGRFTRQHVVDRVPAKEANR